MKTLRTPAQFCEAGLVAPERRPDVEAVAARYAVALPGDLAALIDRNDPHDPIARQFVPAAAELDTRPEELSDPIGDDAHSPVEGIVHRYPDRVLLKLTHVCAVYCRFCFRREMVGPGKTKALSPAALKARARLHPQRPQYLGSDPHRRRSAGAVAAPPARGDEGIKRHRARQDRAHPHPRAGGGAPAHHARAGARDEGQGQGGLCRRARQSRARADQGGARRLRAHGRCRPAAARAIGAAGRRQRHAAGARRADARLRRMPHQAVLSASRRSRARHRAPAYRHRHRTGSDAWPCAGGSRASASRATCSTFRAATANRRSARITSRAKARTGLRIMSSKISMAGGTSIRRARLSGGSPRGRTALPPPPGRQSR